MKGLKKVITSMLLAAMTITVNPQFVLAEEGELPVETQTPEATPEVSEEPAEETPVPETTPEPAQDSNLDVEQEQPTTVIEVEENNEPEADPEQNTGLTDEEIETILKGDKERVSLFKDAQTKIDASKQDAPHANIVIDGNGELEVTAPDGSVAILRWEGGAVEYLEAEDSPYFTNIDDANVTTEEALREQGATDEIIEEMKDEDGNIHVAPQYKIYGNDGDTFHVKVIADESETITVVNEFTANSMEDWRSNNLLDAEDTTEKEFDVTVKANAFEGIHVSFTQNTGVKSMSNLYAVEEMSTMAKAPKAGGSGTINITGFTETRDGTHTNLGDETFYNNACWMNSSSDAQFQSYINQYRAINGTAPHAECQNHGDYAAANGNYGFSYSVSTGSNGNTYINVSIETRVDAYSRWGFWDSYFIEHPLQQAMYASFEIPPQKHDVTLSITKKSDCSYLIDKYPEIYSLEGAQFDVYLDSTATTSKLDTLTTDKYGKASKTFKDLDGQYTTLYLRETKAPKGHELRTDIIPVSISGDNAVITVEDKSTPVSISIKKVDDADNPVVGAKLQLTNKNTNAVIASWTSDGTEKKFTVSPGDYQVDELEVPDGYYPAESVNFEAKPNITTTQTFTMVDKPISYSVLKVDKKTQEVLEGVTLQLQDESGRILEEWKSGKEAHKIGTGNVMNAWSGKLKYGTTYLIHESETIDGYEKLLDDVKFTVNTTAPDDYKMITIKVGNVGFDYRVTKVDADTRQQVSGAVLQLKDGTGKVVDEWTTDGTPHAINKKLLSLGVTYTIHESKAPDGYYRAGEDVQFKVENSGGATQIVSIADYKVKYNITKIDGESKDPIEGVKLAVYDKSNNKKIDEWTTDGKAHDLSGKLTSGKTYYIKELSTVKGYYLSNETKEFTVDETAYSSVQKRSINVTFTNKRIRVKAGKRDGVTKQFLAGAELAIEDENGNRLYTFTSTGDADTDIPNKLFEQGKTYYLSEVKAPDGYYFMKDETGKSKVKFTIPSSWEDVIKKGKIVTGVIVEGYDYKIKYSVAKIDENGDYVEGVHLALYNDGGTQIEDWTTTKQDYEIQSQLVAGKTYTVKELGVPTGYYKVTNQQISIPLVVADENMATVVKEQPVRVTVVDQSISWKITKEDGNGNTLTTVNGVPFVFEVYDTNGTNDNPADDTLITTLSTDEPDYIARGYFEVKEKIATGKTYRVHEVSYPNGYTCADDVLKTIPQEVQKNADGSLVEIKTTVVDDSFKIKFKKVDETGKILKSYVDSVNGESKNFTFDVYDMANPAVVAFTFDTSEYKDDWVDITDKVEWQHTYKVVERDYPTGYYKANDFVFAVNTKNNITITMTDPTIKARFRKYDTSGNVLNGKFEFKVVQKSNGKTVDVIDLTKADAKGYVYFGDTLLEGTTYQIIETDAARGYNLAKGYVEFTTPSYYGGANEVNKGCVIRSGDNTQSCVAWEDIY